MYCGEPQGEEVGRAHTKLNLPIGEYRKGPRLIDTIQTHSSEGTPSQSCSQKCLLHGAAAFLGSIDSYPESCFGATSVHMGFATRREKSCVSRIQWLNWSSI
jgi:hypothetical protein